MYLYLEMRKMAVTLKNLHHWAWLGFLGMQLLAVQLFSHFPKQVENFYSKGCYPHLSRTLRLLTGQIPFSIGDLFYFFVFYRLIRFAYTSLKNRTTSFDFKLLSLAKPLCILHFFFYLFWGLNYARRPLSEELGIKSTSYEVHELTNFTVKLIKEINALQFKLTKDKQTPVPIPYDSKTIYKLAARGFENLGQTNKNLSYTNPSVKKSLFSIPLSYMGFSGYFNPFTGEAQVNHLPPSANRIFTTCHEIAHQLGYADEKEANFIGYLACEANKDPLVRYAGKLVLLKYLLADIRLKSPQDLESIKSELHPGVSKNMRASKHFWKRYENAWEPLFEKTYDAFLKINGQRRGIQSYQFMVGMVLNHSKSQN